MQANKIILYVIALAALCFSGAAFAQPDWEVNPNDFVYSMTITGQLNTDGYLSTDVNDVIAAFIDDECRGTTNVKYQEILEGYFVFLMIYSNEPVGTVNFIIYDASEDQEFPVKNTLDFAVNDIVGSMSSPYIFSASDLNNEAKLLSFNIPNQFGETVITGNDVYLQERWDGNLMGIVAEFTMSEGAKAYVGSTEQTSGVTSNDFTNPVQYYIESADHSTSAIYTVYITTANDIPTDILLSENQKAENEESTLIGNLTTITENPAEIHVYSLVPGEELDNHIFQINGNELHSKQPLNYEEKNSYLIKIRSDDNKGGAIEKEFEISVLNVNDEPENIVLTDKHTPQTVLPHTNIGKLVAIDEDITDNHTFELIQGDGKNDEDNFLFYIENNKLKNYTQIYFFPTTVYKIFVRVTDSSGGLCDVAMRINTIEQGMPPHNLNLSNNVVIGINDPPVFVGILSADDVDQITGHRYEMFLYPEKGPDNSAFEIKNNALYLKWPKPIIEQSVYQIIIAAIDSMENHYTEVFYIEVKEKLGESEFYLDKNQVFENQSLNTVVGQLDSEVYNCSEYNYSLPLEVDLNTYSNDKFTLVGRTVLTNRIFDFEEKNWYKVRVRIADASSETEQDVAIEIIDRNDPPSGFTISTQVLDETLEVGEVVANFEAVDQDVSDSHQFSLVIGNGQNDEGNSTFSITGNQLFLAKPVNFEQKEFYNILVKVTDQGGKSIEKSVRLRVTDANDPPEFLNRPGDFAHQDQSYAHSVQVLDSEGDVITIWFENLPDWLNFNSMSNVLSGTPRNNHVGVSSFTIIASDGKEERRQDVIITVLDKNDPPIVNFIPGKQEFYTGKQNEVSLPADCFIDPDVNDVLTYSLLGEGNTALPEWLNFDPVNLTLHGNPPGDAKGEYRLKLTATDQGFLKEFLVFVLKVSFPTTADTEKNGLFRVYPNPVANELNIYVPEVSTDATIEIRNISGQVLQKLVFFEESKKTVPFNFSSGVYFVHYKNEKNRQVKKVLKK